MRGFTVLLAAVLAAPCWAAPGYAVWGEFKYKPGFTHFEYVNPDAPKGGEMKLVAGSRISTFDKYNPFTLKGSAPSMIAEVMFETLLTGSMDEVGVGYGLLAEDVEVSPDRLSATFKLNPAARFHNGDPVRAADVKHSFETLISKYASPAYGAAYAEIAGCDVIDDRTVRFRFKKVDRQLPLLAGSIPVFSTKWGMENGKAKTFDNVVMDIPIASGAYKIGPMSFGRDITYVRDPNYWGRNLAVRKGQNNFDRLTVKIYRDNTAQLEALKAGEFDIMQFYSAGDWTRRVTGPRVERGELIKSPFAHRRPDGYQSYVLNNRLPKFQDRRVRMALELAMDYEYMNRQLFRSSYTRVKGLFGNTDCEANGLPTPGEVALMESFRGQLPPEAFGPMALPPRTDGNNSLRENLRKAKALLAEAGWNLRDGALRNSKGEAFSFELLDSTEGKAVTTTSAWKRALEKLGIEVNVREVDYALYQERLDTFKFDVVTINFPGTHFPGSEYVDLLGSKAADTQGSGNIAGIKSPVIDGLIDKMAAADNKADYLAACRALDRVYAHGHYMVPAWTNRDTRIAYNPWVLEHPKMIPQYPPEGVPYNTWFMTTWWARMPPKTSR